MRIKRSQLKRLIEDYLYEKDEESEAEEEEESKDEEEEVDSPVKDLKAKIEDTKDDFQAYNTYKSWGEANPNETHDVPKEVKSYLTNTLGYDVDNSDMKNKTYDEFVKNHGRNITVKTNAKKIDIEQGKA